MPTKDDKYDLLALRPSDDDYSVNTIATDVVDIINIADGVFGVIVVPDRHGVHKDWPLELQFWYTDRHKVGMHLHN